MRTYILRNADFQEVEKLNDLWNHSNIIAEITLDQHAYVLSMGLPSKCQLDQGDGPILWLRISKMKMILKIITIWNKCSSQFIAFISSSTGKSLVLSIVLFSDTN